MITQIIFYLALILVGLCAGAIITGNTIRSYLYYEADAVVSINNKSLTVTDLAQQYQPVLSRPQHENIPTPLSMWWEAIANESEIVLVYHPVWEDEFHPNPIVNKLYYIYRGIVYGFPVRDIEFIQINIERTSGEISKVRFEGSIDNIYNTTISQHTFITITKQNGDYYIQTILPDGKTITEPINIVGPTLKFGAATWSHQFVFLENTSNYYTQEIPFQLEYLTDKEYSNHKLARRSQGDFATQEGVISVFFRYATMVVFVVFPTIIARILHRKNRDIINKH